MYLDKQSDFVSVSSGSETPLDGVICVMWGVLVYTGHHRRSLLWNNILCQKIYGELGGTGIELDSSHIIYRALIWYWDHLKNFIAEIPQGPLGMSIGTIWVTQKWFQGPPARGF